MRRLMLLRHAKTEHDAPSGHDQDRRLDDRGRLDAAAIGTWIGRHPPLPDAVLVSTAVRAQQTWEIAGEAMKDSGSGAAGGADSGDIYGADPAELVQIVRTSFSNWFHRPLLLVGHNPGMHELALMLTGSGDRAATQGARRQSADLGSCRSSTLRSTTGPTWHSARGRLVLFVSPKLLKHASDD